MWYYESRIKILGEGDVNEMLLLGIVGILYGIVSYFNWKELKLWEQYQGYRPLHYSYIPLIGALFRNFGSIAITIFVLYYYPFPISLSFVVGIPVGYFIGGLLFMALMPFSGFIGRYVLYCYILLFAILKVELN